MEDVNDKKLCNCGDNCTEECNCKGNCSEETAATNERKDPPCQLIGTDGQCEDCPGDEAKCGQSFGSELAEFFKGLGAAIKAEKEKPSPYPLTINSIGMQKGTEVIETGIFHRRDVGKPASIRPCGEEYGGKTYLGVYLGEIATSFSASIATNPEDENDKALAIGFAGHNPAVYVFELNKIIFGYESWWSILKKPEDLKAITDDTINNVWYVQLMKDMLDKEEAKKNGPTGTAETGETEQGADNN